MSEPLGKHRLDSRLKPKKPISDAYSVFDTDLARENLENDIPAADLQDWGVTK